MGIYRDRVLPRVIDVTCGSKELGVWREQATEGLHGRVIEIGFGSGLNMAHYPAAVERVLAVDPALRARQLAAPRIAAAGVPVEYVGLDGQTLAVDDASCDGALCTFTLCTIPDPERALAELHRVLRPGGRFHFLEHGLAEEPAIQRWQRRIEPLQRRLFDGCHLTRQPADLVVAAGFRLERCERRFARGPKPWSWFTVAAAIRT